MVVSLCYLLKGEFLPSYLPCALKLGKAKPSQSCEVRGGRLQGTAGSGMRVLVPVITGGYWEKPFPGRWVLLATSLRSCLGVGNNCVRMAVT